MQPTTKLSKARAVKKIVRSSGGSLQKLAKTTGTTKAEVRKLFTTTARNLASGGVSKGDTRALQKALSGGPTAGIARTPESRRAARVATRRIRRAVKKAY